MIGNPINAKREAPELHELSSEELDAVAGGDAVNLDSAAAAITKQNETAAAQQAEENKQSKLANMTFQQHFLS
jgi:hypothetical protein